MTNSLQSRSLFRIVTPLAAIGLFFFYQRYVPLPTSFQVTLVPVLMAVFLLSAWDVRRGLMFFAFAFPLINSLPYFFGIHEHVPHAPTALVLMLFYLLGWLVYHCWSHPPSVPRHPVLRPLLLIFFVSLISGIITFLRYANFFPFRTDHIYELTVNAMGVSAGGAIMSVVFTLLNALTGLAFFFTLLDAVRSREDVKRLISALTAGVTIAILFGLIQHLGNLALGNHPTSLKLGLVNGTFQDALAFGAFLSIAAPMFVAMTAIFRGPLRVLAGVALLGGLFILPHTGSKSGLLSTGLSIILFLVFAVLGKRPRSSSSPRKRPIAAALLVLLLIIAGSVFFLSLKNSVVSQRMGGVFTAKFMKALEQRRALLWRTAGAMILQYPLAGIGVGAFVIERPNFEKLRGASFWYTESAENYFLHQGAELGLIGLILILWVFWEVGKVAVKNFRDRPGSDEWRLIRLGAACGLISHFLNILVHTFVGTVEVWYVFWLFAGVIYLLTGPGDMPEKRRPAGRWHKFAAALLIFIYGVSFLWNSTHSLSLPDRTERLKIQQNFGLYPFEKEPGRAFRWMGKRAAVTVRATGPVVAIPLLASHPDLSQNPVSVKIYLVKNLFRDKLMLGEVVLRESVWKTYRFSISQETGRDVTFLFAVSRTWNPQKALKVSDPRNLGAAIGIIYFQDNK